MTRHSENKKNFDKRIKEGSSYKRQRLSKSLMILFLIISALLSSCEKEDADRGPIQIVFIYPDTRDEWDLVTEGAERTVQSYLENDNKSEIVIKYIKCEYPSDMDEVFSGAVSDGCDGICIAMPTCLFDYPGDRCDPAVQARYDSDKEAIHSVSVMIKDAIEDGLPVITIGNDQYLSSGDPSSPHYWYNYMASPSRLCFVGSDNIAFGRRLAEKAIELQGGYPKLYVQWGGPKNTEQWYRNQGMHEVLGEECFIDGLSVEGHPFPYDIHGVYWSGEGIGHGDDPNDIKTIYMERACLCEQFLEYDITVLHEDFNTVITTWAGGNSAANVFRNHGWNDADTNREHVLILSEYSRETIKAVKERFATCALIEDRETWGAKGAETLINTIKSGVKPDSDFIETPVYWIDYSAVYDWSME